MKKVGFIDHFLNEWHADNYPTWIRERSGGEYEVCYAWAETEPPAEWEWAVTNAVWAERNGIALLSSPEEVIEKSDVIIVLSPDNSDRHYDLAEKALCTGKPVYIDKTLSDSGEEAARIFRWAEAHGTPCFSSSALRFAKELAPVDKEGITSLTVFGGGQPDNYVIHYLETAATLMGTDIDRVTCTGSEAAPAFSLHYRDGRHATLEFLKGAAPFEVRINRADRNEDIVLEDDFFLYFVDAMLAFFRTREIPVSHGDTERLMALRAACLTAMRVPGQWVTL